jgi:hypothetical protein
MDERIDCLSCKYSNVEPEFEPCFGCKMFDRWVVSNEKEQETKFSFTKGISKKEE